MPQIMITLNQIACSRPCLSGWWKILDAKEHLGMDTPWPLSDALDTNGLRDTQWALRCLLEHAELWSRYVDWCLQRAGVTRHTAALWETATIDELLYFVRCAARRLGKEYQVEPQTTKLRQILDAGEWVDDNERSNDDADADK